MAWHFDPGQPRVESGPTAGQWTAGPQTADEEAKAGADEEAKRLFAQMLNMTPDQQAKFLAGLNPDQLTRLGKFANLGEGDTQIKAIREQIGKSMEGRGMDPTTAGFKPKKGKKPAAKKGGSGKSGGGGGSKGGGGKSSGGGSKKSSGGGSKSSGSKSSGSKSSSSKSSGSKTPAKTPAAPKPAPAKPAPPEVKPIGGLPTRPGLPGGPGGGPPTVQTSRPARRLGKRRRPGGGR